MIAEKAFLSRFLGWLPRFLRHAYLILAVLIGWVLFEMEGISQIGDYLGTIFGAAGVPVANAEAVYVLRSNAVLFVVAIVACFPLLPWVKTRLANSTGARRVAVPVIQAVLLVVSYAYLLDSTFNPFLYFRF